MFRPLAILIEFRALFNRFRDAGKVNKHMFLVQQSFLCETKSSWAEAENCDGVKIWIRERSLRGSSDS